MTVDESLSLRDLAFIVCTALSSDGTTAVLSGGGAATVYAPDVCQSRDLDFVLSYWSAFGASSAPLLDLGFVEIGAIYRHPKTTYTVELLDSTLSVGSHPITRWDTLRQEAMLLHILSPTDSVRDRLAGFLFYNDFSSLEQALGVARACPIDLDAIERWCASEGESAKFEIFRYRHELLRPKTRNPKP